MDISKIKVTARRIAPKRRGRGTGSTLGKTGGRGNKGSGQRSGKKLPYVGYRGGNVPYLRILPKRGFTPHRKVEYQIVNLGDIEARLSSSTEIDPAILKKANLIKDDKQRVKILARQGENFSLKATFKADKFSSPAKKTIEAQGGRAECLKR